MQDRNAVRAGLIKADADVAKAHGWLASILTKGTGLNRRDAQLYARVLRRAAAKLEEITK